MVTAQRGLLGMQIYLCSTTLLLPPCQNQYCFTDMRGTGRPRTIECNVTQEFDASSSNPDRRVFGGTQQQLPDAGDWLGVVVHGGVQGVTLCCCQGLEGVNVTGHEEETEADNDSDCPLNQKQPAAPQDSTTRSAVDVGTRRQVAGCTTGSYNTVVDINSYLCYIFGTFKEDWTVHVCSTSTTSSAVHCVLVQECRGCCATTSCTLAYHCQPRRPPCPSSSISSAAMGAPSACETMSAPISQPRGMVTRSLL